MKPFTSKDIWQFKNITDLKTKAGRVIFTQVQADPNQANNRYLWQLLTWKDGQAIKIKTFTEELNFILRDADHVLFCQDNQLQELELETGKRRLLAKFDCQKKLSLVGQLDAGHVLLQGKLQLRKAQAGYQIIDELPSHFNGQGLINKQRQHLFSGDIASGQVRDLINDPYFNVHDFYLQGNRLYLIGDSYQTKRPTIPAISLLDWRTGDFKELLAANTFDASTSLFFNQLFALGTQAYLFGNDDPQKLNKNPQFYRLDDQGHYQLIAHWDRSLGSWIGTDQAMGRGNVSQVFDQRYYFVSTFTDHACLCLFDGRQAKSYFDFAGSITAFSFKAADDFYFIGLKANQAQRLYHYDHGKISELYDPNQDLFAGKYLAQAQKVAYQASDGSKQHGWLLYPRNYQAGKKYPGILEIHGGPKTAYGAVFYHEMQVLASHGYFVFFSNIHGSDGQGNDFADISGHWGEADYQDLMLFTDQVLKTQPAIAAQHLGVAGGSYGGFMTNWIIGHTHRFAAACSQRSIASEISHSFLSDIGPADNFFENQATLAEDPAALWQHSPLKYASQVKTPTLFIHSDQDYRCPLPEGMQMLHALLWYGVEAKMCLFHGENHELSRSGRPANRVKRLDEMLVWFDQYLKA
jgi:dipeptidyl aminopeptidase/acylaminoacyl peptidase